jgi:hypothetical protein
LLRHDNLAAWFEAPPAPETIDRDPEGQQVPDVLAHARRELESILYIPGVLTRAGFPDAEQ